MFYYNNRLTDEYCSKFLLEIFDQFTSEDIFPVYIDFELIDYSKENVYEGLLHFGIDINNPKKVTKSLPKHAENAIVLLAHLINFVISQNKKIMISVSTNQISFKIN